MYVDVLYDKPQHTAHPSSQLEKQNSKGNLVPQGLPIVNNQRKTQEQQNIIQTQKIKIKIMGT